MGDVKHSADLWTRFLGFLFLWRQSVFICVTDYKYDSAKVGVVYVKALGWTLRTEVY